MEQSKLEVNMEHSPRQEYVKQANSHATVEEGDPQLIKKEEACLHENGESLGGWKSMPFIIGNDICERLAGIGLGQNFFSFLQGQYHMRSVNTVTLLNVLSGTSSFSPLIGAFLADAYLGRFYTILLASILNMIAFLCLCIIAAVPSLRPASGKQASDGQLTFLYTAMLFLVLAAAGLRPCTYAFGADQFEGMQDTPTRQSYFNWYFLLLHTANVVGGTVLVYIQDNQGWVWGFAVPTMAVFAAIVALIVGAPRFRRLPPIGSAFTSVAKVIHAAICKRNLALPSDPTNLYGNVEAPHKASSTTRLKWLDHAVIPTKEDFNVDGSIKNPWRLSTAAELDDVKALTRVAPIWMINVLWSSVMSQHSAFTIPQANTMDHRLAGSSFRIPAASISVFSSLTLMLWMPVYDKLVLPFARKLTGHPRGVRMLQRIGIGFCISLLALVVSGLVESQRRRMAHHAGMANQPHDVVPISIFWLAPQFCLYGLGEAFHGVGLLEFLYEHMPRRMRSMAGALFYTSSGIGHYSGTLIVQLVNRFTGSSHSGHVNWLPDNLNKGHLDYFYYLLATLQLLNFLIFLAVSRSSDVESGYEKHVDLDSACTATPHHADFQHTQTVHDVSAHAKSP